MSKQSTAVATGTILRAEHIRAAYGGRSGVVAVDDVSLDIADGEVLGIAGESGCGKSTLGAVLSLTAQQPLVVLAGSLEVEDKRLDLSDERRIPRTWRGGVVSLLPQGAMNSLSPTVRVGDFAFDVMRAHQSGIKRKAALERLRMRLDQLGLPDRVVDAYPHQLSGGMKQRVVTVLSTLLDPRLLIADEPTSALDVSSQRVLIEMLRDMVAQRIISGVIFITHDLPVLNTVADRIAIMYAGKIVEIGPSRQLIDRPHHPYSAALLGAVLVPEPQTRERRMVGIVGSPPDLADPPPGCRYHPRCAVAMDVCRHQVPPRVGDERRFADCWWADAHPDERAPEPREVAVA